MGYKNWILAICFILVGFDFFPAYPNSRNGELILEIDLAEGSGPLSETKIVIIQESGKKRVVKTNKKGTATLELDLNKRYTLAFLNLITFPKRLR